MYTALTVVVFASSVSDSNELAVLCNGVVGLARFTVGIAGSL